MPWLQGYQGETAKKALIGMYHFITMVLGIVLAALSQSALDFTGTAPGAEYVTAFLLAAFWTWAASLVVRFILYLSRMLSAQLQATDSDR